MKHPVTAATTEDSGSIPARAGIGLRFRHHQEVVETRPAVAWFEVHIENYMGGGPPLRYLEAVRRDYPVSLHGTGLSPGSAQGLDEAHLDRVVQVARRVEPGLISEHLSWSVSDGRYLADLLPLPMTEEALDIVCANVTRMQERLKRAVLIENPSSYLQYRHSTIPEWEFLAETARRTGCGVLCDVNNLYVSARNHGWDAARYLAALAPQSVGEIHLAGHSVRQLPGGREIRIDDHGSPVAAAVWVLYAQALALFGSVPTLIEWDTAVPSLDVLLAEAEQAESRLAKHRNTGRDALAA